MIYHTGSSKMLYVIRLCIISTTRERIPGQIEQAKYHSPSKTNAINLGFQGRTLRKQIPDYPCSKLTGTGAQLSPDLVLNEEWNNHGCKCQAFFYM